MVEDPLVEALEPSGQEGEGRLPGELLDEVLIQLPALRRERDHPVVGRSAVDGVECGSHDVDTKHHARPAAVRVIVDLPRAERCGLPVVEDAKLELGAENRRERATLANPVERGRNEREDVETHDAEP